MLTPEFVKGMYETGFTGTFRAILGIESLETRTFPSTAINLTTNQITVTNTYAVGCRVTVSTSGTLSTNLSSTATYIVVSTNGSIIQLSNTVGGTPIDFTDQGTGTYTVSEVSHTSQTNPSRTVPDVVRIEVGSYQGVATRPSVINPTVTLGNDPTPSSTLTDVTQTAMTFTFNNISGTLPVDFDTIIVIKGGSATPGNSTGELIYVGDMGVLSTIEAGQSRDLTVTLGGF